jgi:glycosyltransferase family protein
MKVLHEKDTVELIRQNRLSIARYGDGELKLCIGRSAKSQKPDPQIVRKLRDILHSNDPRLLVGIPRIYESRTDWPTEKKAQFWQPFATLGKYKSLYDLNKVYGSAFITRPDSSGVDGKAYFDSIKELWRDRNVLLIRGENAGFDKDPSIFETAKSVKTYLGPDRDAFSAHEKILYDCLQRSDEKSVIVLSLGPAATVLAQSFTTYGRQALDLGHLGMFYAHIHPKQKVVCS